MKRNFRAPIAVSINDQDLPLLNEEVVAPVEYIELRADLCQDLSRAYLEELLKRLTPYGKRIILTIRDPSEGGGRGLSDEERLTLYKALSGKVHMIDTEVASGLVAQLKETLPEKTIIGSFHDFHGTPPQETLRQIYKKAKAQGADIVKVATMVNDAQALRRLTMFCLESEGDRVVVGMGSYAVLSRVALPFLGSLFTYASLGRPKAPGQIGVKELVKLMEALTQRPAG